MFVDSGKCQNYHLDNEINAPIANLDLEDWLDFITSSSNNEDTKIEKQPNNARNDANEDKSENKSSNFKGSQSNLTDSIDLCSSLEDLVKTFDKNVKECLTNYKNIDIGQLAPVQVRLQEDIVNDSQIWYTLTGNFGNLLPIDYWSKSLVRKYHNDSLDIKNKKTSSNKNHLNKKNNLNSNEKESSQILYDRNKSKLRKTESLDESFNAIHKYSDLCVKNYEKLFDDENEEECAYDYDYEDEDNLNKDEKSEWSRSKLEDVNDEDFDEDDEYNNENDDDEEDDDELLKDQLDMHSMIISKCNFNDEDLDEPIITAEQVLDEIDSMMTMQDEIYDEMTPDSGCYSTTCLSTSQSSNFNNDLPLDINCSYIKYINTFALQNTNVSSTDTDSYLVQNSNVQFITTDKEQLENLNTFQLNELIEQIENSTKELSEILVQEFALRDEQEYEKETRNTFISLVMSIQEKRRQLTNSDSLSYSSGRNFSNMKKKNRKSLMSLSFDLIASSPTHLTTVIPYNHEIVYSVQQLQILNKLLKAINDDSHQVPELLTTYILKVYCPT